jgi:hypothetical protein
MNIYIYIYIYYTITSHIAYLNEKPIHKFHIKEFKNGSSSYAFVVEQATNHFICTNVEETCSLVCV